MPTQDSRLLIHRDGDIIQISFVDRNILEETSIQQIGDEIAQLIDESLNPRILINFTDVEHLSSAALGTLITINNRLRQKDGQLRLCTIDPQIHEVFKITKLDKLFQIHETVDEATSSFQ